MTAHSERGQGGQPLYEGVVLPANGDPWTPEQQRQVDRAERQPAPGSPPSGQPWGEPWGPRPEAAMTSGDAAGTLPPPPASGPSAPAAPAAAPAANAAPPEPNGQPLPGSSPHQPVSAPPSPAAEIPTGPITPPMPSSPPVAPPPGADGPPLPGGSADIPAGGGRHRGGPATAEPGPGMPQPAPQPQHQQPQSPSHQPSSHQPQQAAHAPQSAPAAAPVSPTDATAYIPPVTDASAQPGGYPQAGPDADPTQMLPPQNGASPVSAPASAANPEETAQLRTPLPPETGGAAAPNGASPQPPAGFESLFRAEPGAPADSPGTTQSLPFFDNAAGRQRNNNGVGGLGKPGGPAAAPYGQPPQQPAPSVGAHRPQGRAARREAERSMLSRISPPVLIGVGVAVVAGLGMALGAALTSGDDKEKKADKPQTKSSAEPAAERSASADPAEPQAKELDKLLAASNDSRAQVVRAVESIKVCKRLRQSAADLKDAAGQRNSLVTRLGQLETDKISGSSQLNSALTRAWKASASADNHYAAWAGEAAAKKGKVCHKGKARPTRHTALAARVSGDATTAKKQAASLWNPTAKKYGLKERAFGDL